MSVTLLLIVLTTSLNCYKEFRSHKDLEGPGASAAVEAESIDFQLWLPFLINRVFKQFTTGPLPAGKKYIRDLV